MMKNNASLTNSVLIATFFVVLIWLLKICETTLGWSLNQLGVYPQTMAGLIGIITAPLIHGSWDHLLSNTLPILLLGSILHYGYPKSRWWAVAIIWVFSGLGVWLFARASYHYGASGITHGMFFYLFVAGIVRRDRLSIALLMIAFLMYGSMLLTILPQGPGISYESHLFGALAGVICAFVFRHWDAKPISKTYSWQQLDEHSVEEDDPIIGDQWKITKDHSSDDSS